MADLNSTAARLKRRDINIAAADRLRANLPKYKDRPYDVERALMDKLMYNEMSGRKVGQKRLGKP